MDQNNPLHPNNQNEEHEAVFPESIGFNEYSNSIQPDNINSPCNCSPANESNLHPHEQTSLYSLPCSTHINNHVSEQVSSQDINSNNDHITQYSSHPTLNEQTSHYTPQHICRQQSISNCPSNELFKIEISGIEIIVRRKSLPDLNQNYLEMHRQPPQQNEQSTSKIPTRRVQNRMHPYHMSAEKSCRHSKINKRDHTVIDSFSHHYCSHSSVSQDQQQNHANRTNRTNGTSNGGSSLNAQNTRINQSENQPQFH
jgi:hypothetical protein